MGIVTTMSDASAGIDLMRDLELLASAASTSWSGAFFIEPRVFAAYAAERLSPDARGMADAQRHYADLYLACGCSLGISRAVAVFDVVLRRELEIALRRLGLQSAARDDVCQIVRERVIVGEPRRRPRIADYAGRGTLAGWIRVVATRIALNKLRQHKRDVSLDDAVVDLPANGTLDPELSGLRAKYGVCLRRALDEVMRSLSAEDRVLLRQRFVEGLSAEQIAALYRKHRITMQRRLSRILRAIRIRAEDLLERDLGCGRSTVISIVNGALSQTDLSVQRYLAPNECGG